MRNTKKDCVYKKNGCERYDFGFWGGGGGGGNPLCIGTSMYVVDGVIGM